MFETLDPHVASVEDALKQKRGTFTYVYLPEAISTIIDRVIDWPFPDLGGKIVKGAMGIAMGISGFIPGLDERARHELHEMGSHLLSEATDPTAEELVRLAEAVGELRAGLTFGDWSRIAKAFGVKSPEEIKAAWDRVVSAWSTAFALPPAAPPAPPAPPPLYKETLATTPTPEVTPPAIPGVPTLFRMTSDRFQPPAPPVAKPLFKLTLG